MDAVNLSDRLATFFEHWQPRTVALFSGHDVMVAKLHGTFNWHKHDDSDDFFLVLEGPLNAELRHRTVALGRGELFIVPRGIEHRPAAEYACHVMLIERSGTPNMALRGLRRRAG